MGEFQHLPHPPEEMRASRQRTIEDEDGTCLKKNKPERSGKGEGKKRCKSRFGTAHQKNGSQTATRRQIRGVKGNITETEKNIGCFGGGWVGVGGDRGKYGKSGGNRPERGEHT